MDDFPIIELIQMASLTARPDFIFKDSHEPTQDNASWVQRPARLTTGQIKATDSTTCYRPSITGRHSYILDSMGVSMWACLTSAPQCRQSVLGSLLS